MASVGARVTNKVLDMLRAPTGMPFSISAISQLENVDLRMIESQQFAGLNVAFDVVERTAGVRYPAVYVYCEGMANLLKEKFRTFSGKVFMAIEVRISRDRLEALSSELPFYASAVTDVLDCNRGEWEPGLFFTGGYKVEFGPIKRGGRNFLQTAKIAFEVEASY